MRAKWVDSETPHFWRAPTNAGARRDVRFAASLRLTIERIQEMQSIAGHRRADTPAAAHAQNTRETELLYKVEINFRGGNDAGAMTDRRFTMSVTDSRKGIFMVGSRNPVASGSVQTQTAGSAVNTQFTYLDAGVSIECIVHAVGDKATMHGSLDLSNIGPNDTPVQCGNSQSYYQANQARSGDHCGTWQAYGIGVD
jgi:hypothetical protein